MENMLQNMDLIHRYLSAGITNQFGFSMDLEGEYTFAQNIVSKKTIIAPTFSYKILSHPQLKLFLSAMMTEINTGKYTAENLQERIEHYEELSQPTIRRII
ncbi:hypothetical protein [Chryseobacterium phocaeense]|uniref:hypothetical protein n=1 Tax=Chryseobacterium phocaeense TaxID=1816690 RepID=UPI0009BC012C|nr:hypothetical protein [Chryseobacterium phocaeense]